MSKFKRILDTAASVAVIAAAITVVLALVWPSLFVHREGTSPGQVVNQSASPISLAGRDTAKTGEPEVGLIIFTDFQCPFCKRLELDVVPRVQRDLVESGRLLLAYRHLPLDIHPWALPAAIASECAAAQGQFWPMAQGLFGASPNLNVSAIESVAASVGLDLARYAGCQKDLAARAIEEDRRVAAELGITGTPSLVIGRVEAGRALLPRRLLKRLQTYDEILAAIEGVK